MTFNKPMHILVTSPIPSHPHNHGNRARVTALCQELQKQGAEIHYVYGGLEDLKEGDELAMRDMWDHVYVLPRQGLKARKQSHRKYHRIDDWYIDAVTDITQRIMAIWKIDYCIANYVWFSKWLEHVPADIPKYIDTHDVFADRHKRLVADGLEASWYSTTPAEENLGMKRADTVIAIQEQEEAIFKSGGHPSVVTLGHFIATDFQRPVTITAGRKIKVGYMASDNPINQQSLTDMNAAIAARPNLLERYDFHLAGAICNSSAASETPFKKLGFVDDISGFYQDTDIVINPNVGGTGLKIKSVEALAYGKAMVATKEAMVGLKSQHPAHQLSNAHDICDFLGALEDTDTISELEHLSRDVALSYLQAQKNTLQSLFPKLYSPSQDNQPVKTA